MKLSKLVMALLLGVASSMAFAAQGGDGTGAFVTGGLGLPSYGPGGTQPFAIRVGGGYNFVKLVDGTLTIGAEAAVADFGKSTWWCGGSCSVQTRGLMVGAVATWDIPHVPNLAAVARVGVINASTTYTANGFAFSGSATNPYVGVGVQYAFNNQLAARVIYEDFGSAAKMNAVSTSLSMISANVVFNF